MERQCVDAGTGPDTVRVDYSYDPLAFNCPFLPTHLCCAVCGCSRRTGVVLIERVGPRPHRRVDVGSTHALRRSHDPYQFADPVTARPGGR